MTSPKISRRALVVAGSLSMLPWLPARRARAAAPVRFIVPFTPGGGTDSTARLMQQSLSDHLGTTVLIENRPGGGTTLAENMLAQAPADGSVIMINTIAHSVNPSLYHSLPYNTQKDFLPISMATSEPMIMVLNLSVPAKNLQEFIALAKSKPGVLNYSTPGNGSPANMVGELLKSMAGINVVHVPYKGAAAATTDLLSGQIQLTFSSQLVIVPYIKAGKVRAIAASTEHRSPALPDVPTFAEAGLPGYRMPIWQVILAPGKTPPEVAQRLNNAVVATLNNPAVKKPLNDLGIQVTPTSLQQTHSFVTSEIKRFHDLIQKMGIPQADA